MTVKSPIVALALLLALTGPAWAGFVRCTTYEEKSLGRLRTLCSDGTRAVHTWNKTLSRWESTVTPLPSSNHWRIDPSPKAPRR
jgi:hypothetical protein